MKNKKSILKRVILVLAGIILIGVIYDICVTGIYARKIPHRFASAEEGRALLLANTDYYAGFTQNDIDFRMRKSNATMEELLAKSAGEIRDFSFIEKYTMDRRIAGMARVIEKNHYNIPLNEEIIYIKTDMTVEMGASGYTHGNEIYLNSTNILFSFIPGASEFFDKLLWHEMFHGLTRYNPEFRAQMYSLIHFTVADSDFELPSCVRENCLSNPDVEHHDSYASFLIDGQEIDCFPVWITTMNYAESQGGTASYEAVVLVPTDGTDTSFTREQASNFDDVFGTNTDYVIDPEECMADNFAYAMLYGINGKDGQGYPDPEIIQGVIDIVTR